MHDIAMAARSVFLMQSLALLAPAPTRPACWSASWERGRLARKWAEGPPVC